MVRPPYHLHAVDVGGRGWNDGREDVKVFVGGVDVTAGFKVAVEGTTATVVLKEPYEAARTPHSARLAARLWLGGYR